MSTSYQCPLRVPEQYPVFLLERIEDPCSPDESGRGTPSLSRFIPLRFRLTYQTVP